MDESHNFTKPGSSSRSVATLLASAIWLCSLALPAAAQQTQSFTSSGSITIPASGNASVYPTAPQSSCVNAACIEVSGMVGVVQGVSLTFNNWNNTSDAFSSTFIDVLLQSPDGRAFLVMSATCKAPDTSTFTMTDAAAANAGSDTDCFATGNWKPTTHHFFDFVLDSFSAPGPGTNYQRAEPDSLPNPDPNRDTVVSNGNGTFAHVFGGMGNANGRWALFVWSAGGGSTGTIGSWTLTITTTTTPLPDLTVALSHTGDFAQGQLGQTYTAIVSNSGTADKPAGSVVSLADTVPPGLVISSMSGSGWTCATPTCTRSDVLPPGQSYPPVTIRVDVASDAASPRVNSVAVSTAASESNTGNNSDDDLTTIVAGTAGSLTVTRLGSGTGNIVSSDGAIDCAPACAAPYVDGSNIILTAVPGIGSSFTGWLGPCTGAGTCIATIDGATAVSATFANAPIPAQILDVDLNGAYEATTDGLLLLRSLFGFGQGFLFDNAVGNNPGRSQEQMSTYLTDIRPFLDIDGNGIADPLTDGVLILRRLRALTGSALIQGAVGPGATRQSPSAIENYVDMLKP
jgi:hypothetical protein